MTSLFPQLTPSGLRFFVKKIANSKKEVQVSLIDNSVSSYQAGAFKLFDNVSGTENLTNTSMSYIYDAIESVCLTAITKPEIDLVVSVGKGKYIPVLGALFDKDNLKQNSDMNKYHMVFKLNEALPSEIKKLKTIQLLVIKSEYVNQDVFYAGKRPPVIKKFGNPLDVDYSVKGVNQDERRVEEYQNYNQLSGSVGENQLISQLSSSYQDRLVDYRNFNNFVFFGSAKKRLENFKTKIEEIEGYQLSISKSLYSPGQENPDTSDFSPIQQTSVTSIRQQYFNEINRVINSFTDYEKFLYYDNYKIESKDHNTSASAPGLGKNFIDSDPLVSSTNITKQTDYEGFPYAYFVSASSAEQIAFTAGKYKVEESFNNSTSSFYLSFLMRASSSFEQRFGIINFQTSSFLRYPEASMNTTDILLPVSTGSEYRRYVFESSASHWIPTSGYQVSHPGNPITDWSAGSNQIEIIPGGTSVTGSTIRVYGDYGGLVTTPPEYGNQTITGSFLPKGDLFNISLNTIDTSNATSAIITDVKLTSKNPNEFLPFSNINSISSSTFTEWYNGLSDSASFFDNQNIHRLYNNIPSVFQTMDTNTSNEDMLNYIDMMGEFFDEYKVLVDDFYRVFDLGFSDYEIVPPRFNTLLANSLGYNFLSEQSGSILEKFGLFESFSSEQKEYNNKLFNNILNNIHYIYKTKGTDNSVRALLNCYGLPSNVLKIREPGQNLKAYDQSFLSNDTNISSIGALSALTGSVTYEQNTDVVRTLIVHPEMELNTDWNNSTFVSQSAIQGMFKMPVTENTMSLIESRPYANKDNKKYWRILAIPENGTNSKRAKIKFELNNSANGGAAIAPNNINAETAYVDILDNTFTHILLQRSASGASRDTDEDYTYEIQVGKLDGEELKFITASSLTTGGSSTDGQRANKNWLTGSADGLLLANDYTGSIGEVRTWKEPLSIAAFKQHIYNPRNLVGNHYSSSIDDIVSHFRMNENYKSGSENFTIIDSAANTDYDGSFNLDTNLFNSQSFWYDYDIVQVFNFPVYGNGGASLQYNDNTILIPDTFTLKDDLRYDRSVIQQNHNLLNADVINTPVLDFSRSPQNVINDFIKDNLGNLDFNDLFADPRDEFKDTYPDLEQFNNDFIFKYNISIQINKFKRAVERIFNSSLVESAKKIMPARANLVDGVVIKPIYTERTKFPPLKERPSVEKLNDNAGTLSDTTTLTPGEEFLPSETTFDNLNAEFEETTYPWYDNTGDNLFNVRDGFDKDFSQRPEATWGTSSNDTHFINKFYDGKYNDGNTTYFETQDVFETFGDIEEVTGSFINGVLRADYNKETTFLNKKISKATETIQERELGSTLQYVSVDSSSYGKLIDTEFRRPQNHHTTFGGHSHMNLGRIYEGYQHRGDTDNLEYVNNRKLSEDTLFTDKLAHNTFKSFRKDTSNLLYEDLSTQAFYRIKIDNKGKGKLKVIRNDESSQ